MSITSSFIYRLIPQLVVLTLVMLFSSCGVIPKDYPAKTPFVFKYNVTVDGNYTTAEKNELESKLSRQLDDSIRVRTSHKLLYKGRINAQVLNKPPVFKTANAEKSILFMKALLVSIGYFKDSISYTTTIDTVNTDQYVQL